MSRMRYSTATLILAPVLVILLAGSLGHNPHRRAVVLEHVTVIDVRGGPPSTDMSLLLVGDQIVSISASGAGSPARDADVVDLSGKYVIPGLWDMHVHALQTERFRRLPHLRRKRCSWDMRYGKSSFRTGQHHPLAERNR